MIADEFTQLVYHLFAHVRLLGLGDLYDRRYVAWAAGRFVQHDHALLVHDAELLARLWNADPRYDRLHRTCELFRGWAEFRAGAGRSLAELEPAEVAEPRLLASLRELDGAELVHAALALSGPAFVRVFAELRPTLDEAAAQVRAWIDALAQACPGLAEARVELVWAMGMHGRGLSSRILVGAPADWSGCEPARQAVLAAHEHAVLRVGEADYVAQEWVALTELAWALRGASAELRDAHREWLASLGLADLLAACVARGYLDADDAAALIREPLERSERLSAARAAASR